MKQVLTGTFLAATFAVGLAAQTPPQNPPPTPQSQPPMQEAKDAAKAITVTGCLKAGDTAESYVLSDLKWGKAGDKAVGTSGAGVPAAIASATSLKLTGSPSGAKLSEHVGHTVEVSGSVSEKSSAPSAPADPASARPASAAPSLNVRTVKMVSATCTP
jgi:hypothetical protein